MSSSPSSPSNQHDQLPPPVSEETNPDPELDSSSKAEEDGSYYLSGKPFFDLSLSASNVSRPYLNIHKRAASLLPRATVPVVLSHGGKNWNMTYHGNLQQAKLEKWKQFVEYNSLKFGDACVFEIMESSEAGIRFKVHILKNELPPELLELIQSRGKTPESAICLD